MFCPNCGSELKDGATFCPNCGSQMNKDRMEKMTDADGGVNAEESATKKQAKSEAKAAKKQAKVAKKQAKRGEQAVTNLTQEETNAKIEKKRQRKKRRRIIGLCVLAFFVIIIIIVAVGVANTEGPTEEEIAESYCNNVKQGYLGSYDTVEVQDILESSYTEADWNYGKTDAGDYIVEFTDDDNIQIQFTISSNDEEDFTITGFDVPNTDYEYSTSEVVEIIHSLYWAYGIDNENTGIDVDSIDEADNSVLIGHWGPVEEVEIVEEVEEDELSVEPEEKEVVEEESEEAEEPSTDEEDFDVMSDEEFLEILEEEGYNYESVDEVREILYEFDTEHTEDEISAMDNNEMFDAFFEMMLLYADEEWVEEESETVITSATDFLSWYRTASVGDTITLEAIVSTNSSDGVMQCEIYNNSDWSYFYIVQKDSTRYLQGDRITATLTLRSETSVMGYPYFDEVSITLN